MERRDIQENYFIKKLNIGDSISNFDCGDEDLNDFILNESGFYRKALLAVDAYLDAIPFYLKNGFVLLNQEENDIATRLMFFDLQTLSQH